MNEWLLATIIVGLGAGLGPGVDPNDPDSGGGSETDPNDPPGPDPDPDPPPEPPDPDPLPEPGPEPSLKDPSGGGDGGSGDGGGDGGVEPDPGTDPGTAAPDPERASVAPTPFAQLDVAGRNSEIELGGDLSIGPVCPDEDDPFACSSYRVGLRARLPITQSSTSGAGRAAVDSLDGLSGAWRVSGIFDFIRDATTDESGGLSQFYLLTLQAGWGVERFEYSPDGGVRDARELRHSFSVLGRFLYYRYPPRKTRVAPQLLVRYERQWADANTVGVLFDDGDPDTPMFTVPTIIDGPRTTPVFAVTVPVLLSIQSGRGRAGAVLSQFGLGPAVSYAAAGVDRSYNPFGDVHVLRLENWIYWYPVGKAGALAASQTNVRLGIAPFVDVFLTGSEEGAPRANFGVLAEVKVGVRGYEY